MCSRNALAANTRLGKFRSEQRLDTGRGETAYRVPRQSLRMSQISYCPRVRPDVRAILAVAGYRSGHDLAHKSADRCNEVLGALAGVGADVLGPAASNSFTRASSASGSVVRAPTSTRSCGSLYPPTNAYLGWRRWPMASEELGPHPWSHVCGPRLLTPSAKDAVTGLKAVR